MMQRSVRKWTGLPDLPGAGGKTKKQASARHLLFVMQYGLFQKPVPALRIPEKETLGRSQPCQQRQHLFRGMVHGQVEIAAPKGDETVLGGNENVEF